MDRPDPDGVPEKSADEEPSGSSFGTRLPHGAWLAVMLGTGSLPGGGAGRAAASCSQKST